ncbi:hypothetical protein A2U01_0083361, partial [Trifolium medium]|nr:hypothetical protein [Trifolium medium]
GEEVRTHGLVIVSATESRADEHHGRVVVVVLMPPSVIVLSPGRCTQLKLQVYVQSWRQVMYLLQFQFVLRSN